MTYELKFKIPKLPPILSNGSHRTWQAIAGIKKKWQKIAMDYAAENLPPEPLKKASAVFTRHSSVEPDYDNMVISFKAIRDGLVKAGVLEDDHPRVLKAEYKWQRTSPKTGHVTIELKEEI